MSILDLPVMTHPLVTLEPLSHDHAPALAVAAAEGDLWRRAWYTSVPEPDAVGDEIDRRLALHAARGVGGRHDATDAAHAWPPLLGVLGLARALGGDAEQRHSRHTPAVRGEHGSHRATCWPHYRRNVDLHTQIATGQ